MRFFLLCSLFFLLGIMQPVMSSVQSKEATTYPPHAFTVMSFNIRYGTAADKANSWHYRKEAVAKTIHHHEPEIFAVQEALGFQVEFLQVHFPSYHSVGVGRDDGGSSGEHAAIFFKKDRFSADSSGTFWFSDTPHEPGSTGWGNRLPRICTWVHLRDRMSGQSFTVNNVHLDHRSRSSREKSIYLLKQRFKRLIPKHPVILLGDFNAIESSGTIRFITTPDTFSFHLVDTFRKLHPGANRCGTLTWFTGFRIGPRIDYIFTSTAVAVHEARILRHRVDGRFPSDHFPILAKLSMPSGPEK